MARTTQTSSSMFQSQGIVMVISFFLVMVINAVIIYFANSLFPNNVVLGTSSIPMFWAVILNAAVISLATIFALPFVNHAEKSMGRPWSPPEMMGIYLVVNFVTIWLLGRLGLVFGLGVSSWLVVLLLSAVLDFFQGMVMMMFEKFFMAR